jgi:aminoglycoside phosphotransferase (APT) family kinase protein
MQTLDPLPILAHLGITDAEKVEPVTGGMDTAIWRVQQAGNTYALRVFRPEQTATCEREVAAMEIARAGGVTVPDVIRRGVWEDRPVLLLSWINGQPLARVLPQHPTKIWPLGTAFGREQAAIHRLDPPAHFDPTAWIEWAGDEPDIRARLYDLPTRKTKLLHLDFHPLNVMAEGSHISGVLDWANARAGDPRADFARTYTILMVEPISPNGDSLLIAAMRRLLERAWRRGYQQAGGALDEMALFYAWAGAAMVRDLSPRISKPGHWLQDRHLDPVRAWTTAWKKQAGIERT